MVFTQRRAQRSDDVVETHLMGRDHVGVTLDDGDPTRLPHRIPRQVCPVKDGSLVKERRLGAVQVLGNMLPLSGQRPLDLGQNSPAKPERSTPFVMDRKDQPTPKPLSPESRASRQAG